MKERGGPGAWFLNTDPGPGLACAGCARPGTNRSSVPWSSGVTWVGSTSQDFGRLKKRRNVTNFILRRMNH